MLAGQNLWSHAYQPISHSYLKNLSCYSPNWHTFKKYVSKNHNRERKVHIRDSTLFVRGKYWPRHYVWQNTSWVWDQKMFKMSSEIFGPSSEIFGCLWICLGLWKSWYSQRNNLIPLTWKTFASIIWYVYTPKKFIWQSVSCKFSVGSRSLVKRVFSA